MSSTQTTATLMEMLFDLMPSGLILYDPADGSTKVNLKGRGILGCPADPVGPARQSDSAMDQLEQWPAYLHPLRVVLQKREEDISRGEVVIHLPGLEDESTIGFSLKIVATEATPIKTLTFTDITQVLKDRLAMDKIKDELNQSKKLASIGTLVAGVAHELNNPLTGISMSSELARMNLERIKKQCAALEKLAETSDSGSQGEKIQQNLDKTIGEVQKIARAAQKAAVLVGDLLSYSKPTQLSLTPLSINGMIRDTLLALKSHPEFSQVVMSFEEHPERAVRVDRVRLEQVFYNLFKNAADAMEGKGKIRVFFTEETNADGTPMIITHVRDTGPGIDTTVIARIFDPFFTTKGHSGVGLGLSISYRTVEQHGGLLSVESEKWVGTEFKVALPIHGDQGENSVDPSPQPA